MIAVSAERARPRLEHSFLAASFVDEPFEMSDLRRVYESVRGVEVPESNLRRKVLSSGIVRETGLTKRVGRDGNVRLYAAPAVDTVFRPPLLRPGSCA